MNYLPRPKKRPELDNDGMIHALTKYVEMLTLEPGILDKDDLELKELSYAQWAATEIRARIMDHYSEPWSEAVDRFVLKMILFERMAINDEIAGLFRTAREAAESFYEF